MSLKKSKLTDIEILSDNWIAVPTKSHPDRTYYYNTVTKKSSWKKPNQDIGKKKNTIEKSCPSPGSSGRKKYSSVETEIIKKPINNESFECKEPSAKGTHIKIESNLEDQKKFEENIHSKHVSISSRLEEKTEWHETQNEESIRTNKKFNWKTEEDRLSFSNSKLKLSNTLRKGNKTPAQSRLMMVRQKCEALAKTINCSIPSLKKDNNNDSQNFTNVHTDYKLMKTEVGDEKSVSSKAHDLIPAKNKSQCNAGHSGSIDDIIEMDDTICDDEEMDWEPSEQEDMIEHIKTIRRNIGNIHQSSIIPVCASDITENMSEKSNLILVIDTNVFISHLQFIRSIQYKHVAGFGFPIVFIPWRVLQELDYLKKSFDQQLKISAIRAGKYINEHFTSRNPRVKGESFEEYSTKIRDNSSADVEILKSCLNIMKMDYKQTVVLITNDRNLETMAIMSNVLAFSTDRFLQYSANLSLPDAAYKETDKEVDSKGEGTVPYQFNNLMVNALSTVLETELMESFDKGWKKIVYKKPPWTLLDILECFIKHWRAVFTFVFEAKVQNLVTDLMGCVKRLTSEVDSVLAYAVLVSQELIKAMSMHVTNKKTYSELLNKTAEDLGKLLVPHVRYEKHTMSEVNREVPSSTAAAPQTTPPEVKSKEDHGTELPAIDPQQCRESVKNVFQDIWDRVRNFCCQVSELASTIGPDPSAVSSITSQFPNAMRTIQEIIDITEKILSTAPDDHGDELVMRLTKFLLDLNLSQLSASELEHLPRYIAFFCRDGNGRLLLSSLANDLKEFGLQIVNGMKLLGFT